MLVNNQSENSKRLSGADFMQRKHVLLGLVAVIGIVTYATTELLEKYLESRVYILPEVPAEIEGPARPVFMANGLKIGEVDTESAIIWMRLTRDPATEPETKWGHVVTGTTGEVRVKYWPSDNENLLIKSEWMAVDADADFTRQQLIEGLTASTEYSVLLEGRSQDDAEITARMEGRFRTPPDDKDPARILFSVITGQEYIRRDAGSNGHTIFQTLLPFDVDFFVHTGDNVYYDQPGPYALTLALARFKWNRMYSFPYQRAFFSNVASYFMKDDHDTLMDDSWPGQVYGDITWEQGLALFREQVPIGEKTYRTFRWGQDLQIWMVEGRDFRSANDMPDGPNKTIWGGTQKKWFYDSVQKSDATFRILITPTPIIGPDDADKQDNHANAVFKTEGDELRQFLGQLENTYIITGDRHWQYITEDLDTGLIEVSSGPTTDKHAGGFKERYRTPMHRYLKIKGGFLTVEIVRRANEPQIVFRHHAVDGSIYNEEAYGL
jgi:alkaline phosphatase D